MGYLWGHKGKEDGEKGESPRTRRGAQWPLSDPWEGAKIPEIWLNRI